MKLISEEGELERMNEQIMILQNKVHLLAASSSRISSLISGPYNYVNIFSYNLQLLEALDWKLMHESDPSTIQVVREVDNVLRFELFSFILSLSFVAFLFLQRNISEMVNDASNDCNLLASTKVIPIFSSQIILGFLHAYIYCSCH